MDIEQFISKKEVLVKNDLANPKHVALCFDKNYAMPAGILITSILANNTHLDFQFHLFALSIDDDDKLRFKKINGKAEIILYYIANKFNHIEYENTHYPISANIRLIVPPLLKDKVEHLLYLDCDMLCNGTLEKLFKINISNYISACTCDVDNLIHFKRMNLKYNEYFNTGMLYINTKRWCEEKVTEQTLTFISKNRCNWPDQDALNTILQGKIVIIDDIFNYQCESTNKYDINFFGKTNLLNEVKLFHFICIRKPWFKLYMNDLYKKYFKESPWMDKKLNLVNSANPSIIRIVSKDLKKNKHYIASIKLKILYLLNKLHIVNSFR